MIEEVLTWAIQLKSLASSSLTILTKNLNSLQINTAGLSLAVLFTYFFLVAIRNTNQRKILFLASITCASIAYTPIYDLLNAVQYHSIFAIIYTSLTYLVTPRKAKSACCMLGSFQLLMAWDSWANATIETFIWAHYETIVCVLHALIIGSFLERDIERIKSILDSFTARLRNMFGYTCNHLRLWYYYANTFNENGKR